MDSLPFQKPTRPHRSPKDRQRYLRSRPRCEGCRRRPSQEVHHIKPRILSGSDDDSNLLALCRICHREWTGVNRTRREWLEARCRMMTEEAIRKVLAVIGD